MSAPLHQAVLRPLGPSSDGQLIRECRIGGGAAVTIGRATDAVWSIPDPGVSRRHARIEFDAGRWMIFDLGSRHGTTVNAQRLANGERMTLSPGDIIGLGEWKFVFDAPFRSTSLGTIVASGPSRVETVQRSQLSGLAQRRLESLMNATRRLSKAVNRESVAKVLCAAAAEGTGNARVLVLRRLSESEYEQIAPGGSEAPLISQSLLQAAAKGTPVQLLDETGTPAGMSMLELNIRTAICAPLMVGGAADCFLYLDSRGREQTLPSDAATYCAVLADLGGLSIERILAADLEQRRRELERDLEAARTAQEMLMPVPSGRVGGLTYSFHATPGRHVAGDFFDVVALQDGRVAFFLGDVSGKGVGAGVLMAAAQGALRTLLMRGADIVDAMRAVNVHLCERSHAGKFITLIAGVFDPTKRELQVADAGHGLGCLRHAGGAPVQIETDASLPLGVDDATEYRVCCCTVQPGARMILFSDGAIEQTDAAGSQFGWSAVLTMLSACRDVNSDVSSLVDAVKKHAGGPLSDDLTVASLSFD